MQTSTWNLQLHIEQLTRNRWHFHSWLIIRSQNLKIRYDYFQLAKTCLSLKKEYAELSRFVLCLVLWYIDEFVNPLNISQLSNTSARICISVWKRCNDLYGLDHGYVYEAKKSHEKKLKVTAISCHSQHRIHLVELTNLHFFSSFRFLSFFLSFSLAMLCYIQFFGCCWLDKSKKNRRCVRFFHLRRILCFSFICIFFDHILYAKKCRDFRFACSWNYHLLNDGIDVLLLFANAMRTVNLIHNTPAVCVCVRWTVDSYESTSKQWRSHNDHSLTQRKIYSADICVLWFLGE